MFYTPSYSEPLTQIQEYIIFPMQLYLKTPTMPENYTLAVFDFIALFYSKASLCSQFVLKDIIGESYESFVRKCALVKYSDRQKR